MNDPKSEKAHAHDCAIAINARHGCTCDGAPKTQSIGEAVTAPIGEYTTGNYTPQSALLSERFKSAMVMASEIGKMAAAEQELRRKLEAENAALRERLSEDWCKYAGPGRGDCEHFVGLPGKSIPGEHDGPDDTVDCYGKPNGWCWACWRGHLLNAKEKQLTAAQAKLAAGAKCKEALEALILGKTPRAYILEQFPATSGHIPLGEWLNKLDEALKAATDAKL